MLAKLRVIGLFKLIKSYYFRFLNFFSPVHAINLQKYM